MSDTLQSFESPPCKQGPLQISESKVLENISWNRLSSPKKSFLSPEKAQHRRKLSDRELSAEVKHCQRTQKSEQCEQERELY